MCEADFVDDQITGRLTALQGRIIDSVARLATKVDAMILMDQVDLPETGVVTAKLLEAIGVLVEELPELLVLADSRRGLRGYPPVCLKMNAPNWPHSRARTAT